MALDQALFFRNELRRAREVALRDAEGFAEICYALERLAMHRGSNGFGLGAHRPKLREVASFSPLVALNSAEDGRFDAMFDVLLEARNSAAHEGAYARNVTLHAVELAIIFEDALQENMSAIEHFMVTDPACARPWEPMSHLRHRMLANSFSYLPVWVEGEGKWKLLADVELARFLRDVESKNERRRRLAMTLEQVVNDKVTLRDVTCVTPERDVIDVAHMMTDVPILVVRHDDSRQLLGIATAFDLL